MMIIIRKYIKIYKNIYYLNSYENDDYLIYKGDFYDFKYNGKGILYFTKENKILFNGIFKNDQYVNGILFYIDGHKQYEGEFENNMHEGKGILFFQGNNKIFYNGIFKKGNFFNGISYDPIGNILYKGEFKEDIPKEGKNIKIYDLKGNLKYDGDTYNFKYEGYEKIYKEFKNLLLYEGEFKFWII